VALGELRTWAQEVSAINHYLISKIRFKIIMGLIVDRPIEQLDWLVSISSDMDIWNSSGKVCTMD